MKGISKQVDELTRELSLVLLEKEYKGVLSTKLRKNVYLVKNDRIHFNNDYCRNNKNRVELIIYDVVNNMKVL